MTSVVPPAADAEAEAEAVWLDNFSNDFPTVRKRLRNISALLRRLDLVVKDRDERLLHRDLEIARLHREKKS
jgi:hypothetical protein